MESLAPGVLRALIGMHWVGLVLGLGSAATADLLGLRIMFFQVKGPSSGVFLWLHRLIGVALVLLLCSGGGLIALRMETWCGLEGANIAHLGPVCLPIKVIAKLILISALVGVALLINAFLLPLSRSLQRPLLAFLPICDVLRVALIGSASLTCWAALFTIPMVKALHAWPLTELLSTIFLVWAAIASSLFLTLCGVRFLLRGQADAIGDAVRGASTAMVRHAPLAIQPS